MDNEKIKQFRDLLPNRVDVTIRTEGKVFWAKITTPDGKLDNCYTQADSISELVVMINDAVKTHFEIPEEARKDVGFYVPLSQSHLRWEEMFNELASLQHLKTDKAVLSLRESELETTR